LGEEGLSVPWWLKAKWAKINAISEEIQIAIKLSDFIIPK